MFGDDDPNYSPLWEGRRTPFHDFQIALGGIAGAYDLRNGRSNDPMSRIVISVDDWHGQRIVPVRRIPVDVFDDVLFAVQQLRDRRFRENRFTGWRDQAEADRKAASARLRNNRSADLDAFRAELRQQYAEAAQNSPQPEAIIGRPAKPGETPNRKGKPVSPPRPAQPAPSKPRS
jgi:hypothetical protein